MNTPTISCPVLSRFFAYRLAFESALLVDEVSKSWARPSLVEQARRAADSVVLNLAEGNDAPRGSRDRARYQGYALKSARETLSALSLAAAKGLGDPAAMAAAYAKANHVVAILVRVTCGT